MACLSMRRSRTVSVIATVLALFLLVQPRAVAAKELLIGKAVKTLEEFRLDPDYTFFRKMVRESYGVLVIPSLVKAGFIVGAESGAAVLMARLPDNTWSYPAFYQMISGSVGLQVGAQVSKVVLVIRSPLGLESILTNNLKLGVGASVAVGPDGAGAKGAVTTSLKADIVAFGRSKGLFGGGAFEGGVITGDNERNERFYGTRFTGRDIIIRGKAYNPDADQLCTLLATF